MSALQTFTTLPVSKEGRKQFISACVDECLSGSVDPLAVEVAIKNLEDIIKAIRGNSDVKAYVMNEAEKHGKRFDYNGADITISQRTTYNYAACGDSVYNELVKEQERIAAVIKAREEMLKTGIDPTTGETFAPPASSTTEFLKISFK